MRKQKTFREIGAFINSIPSALIGNLVRAGALTLAKKYPDEPFEIDWDIIVSQFLSFMRILNQTKDPKTAIRILSKKDNTYMKFWKETEEDLLSQLTQDVIEKLITIYPSTKIPFYGNVIEAARETCNDYKKEYATNEKRYARLKNASDKFYDSHVFIYATTTKEKFYKSVRKANTEPNK
jgi:hypothetical protein